ncbi:hypothetical protein AGOR_G00188630 [Albula goreensis]|uniref:C-type lectin domain-containing protein n=1 Tax=Albula goreensis TaxID=1534307 RepID=A0A8T3CUL7_9TELE|nr:hypothetical protein AGOR_G00188630 [Albula goreensis]
MAERDQLRRTLEHSCSEGWLRLRSSFYYVSSEKKTWSESRQYCREREADLVIINDKEEQIFLSVFYNSWIGLSDREREGTWKWVDGTTLTTGYWRSGEPNNVGNEDCGAVHGGDNPETTWNDLPCSVETYWVCEKAAP